MNKKVLLAILGWFTVSRRILWKSILAIIALSLVIDFENFSPITEDKLLISIFGGLFLGAGIGLAIKNGAVLDGAEILGIFINEKTGISIGVVILWFNVILLVLTGVLFSLEIAMYSILAFLVTAKTIDLILEGLEDYAGLMIVSSKSEDLQEALDKKGGQGLTVYGGVSGIGRFGKKEDLQVIHTIINRIDLKKVYRIIEEIDADAFLIEFDVNNVKGGVLRKYFSKDKLA
ncbi:MAG: YitT family protein [Crocinitomicaceae bacterium]